MILIDSSDRMSSSNSSSDFTINLTKPVIIKKSMQLKFCSIPNTWYLVNSNNNTFSIKYSDSVVENITLWIGDYTVNSLIDSLNLLLNHTNINISFDELLFKFKIVCDIDFQILNGWINNLLGFENNQTSINQSLYAKNIFNFVYNWLYYICINDLFNTNIISSKNKWFTFCILNNCDRNSLLFYYNNWYYENIYWTNNVHVFNSIWVKILDNNFNIVDLNGLNIQMMLNYE